MKDLPPAEATAPPAKGDITELLSAFGRGEAAALDKLLPLVYAELRSIANRSFRRGPQGPTLQPTEVIHEAFLRLVRQRSGFQNRGHFFGLAAQAMRRVLLDRARARMAEKRGGGAERVTLSEGEAAGDPRDVGLIDLDAALTRLAALDERQARIVELRYFAGLTAEEAAEATGLSVATLKREWTLARAFLFRELGGA
jgi:RNA polymerase sigma factor (TIGR02999 family)